MSITIGSARVDEKGQYQGGKPGDQKQTVRSNDRSGEVSMQNFYVHSKGWYILRPKSKSHAKSLAQLMITACDNINIGYSQSDRLSILKNGVNAEVPTNADCSSLVRQCIKEATGKDVGQFTTYNEAKTLENSGLFEKRVKYIDSSKTPLKLGDVLVTCSKGHTVIVVKISETSKPKTTTKVDYYPKYKGTSLSIVQALKDVGEKDVSKAHRAKIAEANGIKAGTYKGTAEQNIKLLTLIKKGELRKA